MKTNVLYVCCMFAILLVACESDEFIAPFSASDSEMPLKLRMDKNVALQLNYDLVTATFTVPNDPSDQKIITKAEEILATPLFNGCRVSKTIYKDGTVDADIEILQLPGMPDYPKNTIGVPTFPEEFTTKRIEIRNGIGTHYNSDGKSINFTQQRDANTAFLKNLVDELGESTKLTAKELEYVFQGFIEAGFTIKDNSVNPNIKELHHTTASGELTRIWIDKTLQQITTRLNYDSEGELATISNFLFDSNENGAAEMSGHQFITFYESPSSGVKMAIKRISQFQNFQLVKNL